ncbi:signal peptidase II [Helicobacter sp. 12S02232-10]|uniref:signal peptidase II n=1 Tax=Helicobacter sp. 12S02232-10 TaxID=1476197 RepID=UPI000BA6B42F|nr:signal peptidase II [Helicobacter sp. 12S02232-10]PAF48746.1 signal peptidase II [Helicobacter sp. 12S02232-10]
MLNKQLKKSFLIFGFGFILVFALDQWIKYLILGGLRWESEALSIILVFNRGVAFSMLSFLGDWLKYLQIFLVVLMGFLLIRQREFFIRNDYVFGIIFGAGFSNILDRFIHGGVVDYIYWHYGFEFAVFNFADAMIDVGVGILILKMLLSKTK